MLNITHSHWSIGFVPGSRYPIDISFRKMGNGLLMWKVLVSIYEIFWKRIDKARIKSSLERLTQPDRSLLFIQNCVEAEEYVQHINFLQSKETF